jgi:hydrogenase/urease accessory protein HupE
MKPQRQSSRRFSNAARSFRVLVLLGLLALAPAAAFGQLPGEEPKKERSWVLGYALTTLCIGLGVFVLVRPAKRKFPKIRKKDDDEDVKPKGH